MIPNSTCHATIGHNRPRTIIGAVLLAVTMLAIAFVLQSYQSANAATSPVSQCNDETASNTGGQGLRCTVTVVNYLTSSGALADSPPSTVTVTKCTGAAGPIAAGAGTCTTTTSTTLGQPVTSVQQCDGEGNGGGAVVICTVTITNYFSSSPTEATTDASVYQCVDSLITGPGAPGVCSPANTPGVTSVGAATVGQCNGSGNGGTNVSFTCEVLNGSPTTLTLPVHIDQCNGSSNGGGSLTLCRATVTNQVIAPTPTATAPTTPTVTPPVVTATPAQPPAETATPFVPVPAAPELTPPGLSTATPGTSTPSPTPAVPRTGTPSPTPSAPAPPESGTPPNTNVPPVQTAPPVGTPGAPNSGNTATASADGGGLRVTVGWLALAIGALCGGGYALTSARSRSSR